MARPFRATFRFGWSGVEAARAEAQLTIKSGLATVKVSGGTRGMVRSLWKLDALHSSIFQVHGLRPVGFYQEERYSNRRIFTWAAFKEDALWRLRQRSPDGGPSRWKAVRFQPIRDIVSAMFFVRSQPLRSGDKISLVAYPGDSPFFVEVEVSGREKLSLQGVWRDSIRMEFRLHRLSLEHGATLQKHGKFRKGTVWISDDAMRFPLRAEVDIFVGSIFAELVTLDKPGKL
jgi:hypothetical protein